MLACQQCWARVLLWPGAGHVGQWPWPLRMTVSGQCCARPRPA